MLEQEIEKKIFKKLEAMQESLRYEIDALCELLANVNEIEMLYYWSRKLSKKQDNLISENKE